MALPGMGLTMPEVVADCSVDCLRADGELLLTMGPEYELVPVCVVVVVVVCAHVLTACGGISLGTPDRELMTWPDLLSLTTAPDMLSLVPNNE